MPKKLMVFQTAKLAWLDIKNALPAMPILTIAAFGVILLHQLGGFVTRPEMPTLSLPRLILDLILVTALNFFLVPFYIAIHRYIILGETTTSYAINPRQPRFQFFFAWSIALQILGTVIAAMITIPTIHFLLAVVFILFLVVLIFFSIRLIPLFPAIAVDSPGASWQNALHDTGDNFWRIFGTGIVAYLPLLIVLVMLGLAFGIHATWATPIISTLMTALTIATASRIYLALGDRLTREGSAA